MRETSHSSIALSKSTGSKIIWVARLYRANGGRSIWKCLCYRLPMDQKRCQIALLIHISKITKSCFIRRNFCWSGIVTLEDRSLRLVNPLAPQTLGLQGPVTDPSKTYLLMVSPRNSISEQFAPGSNRGHSEWQS